MHFPLSLFLSNASVVSLSLEAYHVKSHEWETSESGVPHYTSSFLTHRFLALVPRDSQVDRFGLVGQPQDVSCLLHSESPEAHPVHVHDLRTWEERHPGCLWVLWNVGCLLTAAILHAFDVFS